MSHRFLFKSRSWSKLTLGCSIFGLFKKIIILLLLIVDILFHYVVFNSHVMMQHLLPVVMRGYLGGHVPTALIELGVFFWELCCRKLKINLLERSEKNIVLILCKLKNFFHHYFLILQCIWPFIFQRKLFWSDRYIIGRCILLKDKKNIRILSY